MATPPSIAPGGWLPWYHGWNVVAGTMLAQGLTLGIVQYSFTLWVEPIRLEFGVSRAVVLVSITVLSIAMAAAAPFAGRILDRFPARYLVSFGLLMLVVHLLAMSRIGALWQMWLAEGTLATAAISLAGTTSAQTVVVRWFSRRRGLALGLSALGSSLGGLVLPPLIAVLLPAVGWRTSYVAMAAVAACGIPLCWLALRSARPGEQDGEAMSGATPDAVSTAASAPMRARRLLTDRTFRTIVLLFVPLNLAFAGVQYNLGPISRDMGASGPVLAASLSVLAGAMILGKLTFGILIDSLPIAVVYRLATTAMLICVGLLAIASGPVAMIVAVAAMGISVGGLLPLLGGLVTAHFRPGQTGSVIGLITPFLFAANATPALAALVRDRAGSYVPVYLFLATILMAALLAGGKLGRRALSQASPGTDIGSTRQDGAPV